MRIEGEESVEILGECSIKEPVGEEDKWRNRGKV